MSSSPPTVQRYLFDPTDRLGMVVRRLGFGVRDCMDRQFDISAQMVKDAEDKIGMEGVAGRGYIESLTKRKTAYLTTFVLVGAAGLTQERGLPTQTSAILQLREYALEAIQRLVNDEGKYISDDTIMTINSLAWFEANYGSLEYYRIHMLGLRTIVASRQDWDPSLTGLFTSWLDVNTSAVTKSGRILASDTATDFEPTQFRTL